MANVNILIFVYKLYPKQSSEGEDQLPEDQTLLGGKETP